MIVCPRPSAASPCQRRCPSRARSGWSPRTQARARRRAPRCRSRHPLLWCSVIFSVMLWPISDAGPARADQGQRAARIRRQGRRGRSAVGDAHNELRAARIRGPVPGAATGACAQLTPSRKPARNDAPQDRAPAPYPFTLHLSGNNPAVSDVELLNSYNGINVGLRAHAARRIRCS